MIKKKAITVLSLTLLFSFTISGCQNSDSYTITWKNYDGRVLEIDTDVASGTIPTYDGTTPTREDDEENYFLFSGWSPEVKFTYSDQTHTAQYEVINDESYLAFILNDDNNSYSVISLSNYIPVNIEIPSTYLGKPVTSIGIYAFLYCSSLTLIVIPLSVTSIGSAAFSGCSSLTIYAEASTKPSGWKDNWNSNYRPVVWGYTG